MRVLLFAFTAIALAGMALAYYESSWSEIPTTPQRPFWTAQNPQSRSLESGDKWIINWTVNASVLGNKGTYQLKVLFNSTANVTFSNGNETAVRNVTIYEKGAPSGTLLNETQCPQGSGCSLYLIGSTPNPKDCGTMNASDSCTQSWTVNTSKPINSEWDVYINFTYNSTPSGRATGAKKVRIVEHPWFEDYKQWNCRKMINITNTTGGGTGLINMTLFETADSNDPWCRTLNCTKEFRVTELAANGSQTKINNFTVSDEQYSVSTDSSNQCISADISFNSSLSANVTKRLFVYFNNPLAEDTYPRLNANTGTIFSGNYFEIPKGGNERVWDGFFDSHVDFWFENDTEGKSVIDRNNTKIVNSTLFNLSYRPQVNANINRTMMLERLPPLQIYWYAGHGGIDAGTFRNQTFYTGKFDSPSRLNIYSDNISNVSQGLAAKLVMLKVSFGGDNGTTLAGCPLQNWLSKAFTDNGADCYLSLFGNSIITTCPNCGCDSDSFAEQTGPFADCFWTKMNEGRTIRQAKIDCDNSDVNAVLVERLGGLCDRTL